MQIPAFPCKVECAGKVHPIPVLDFDRSFFYAQRRLTLVLGFLQFQRVSECVFELFLIIFCTPQPISRTHLAVKLLTQLGAKHAINLQFTHLDHSCSNIALGGHNLDLLKMTRHARHIEKERRHKKALKH